jgi:predicted 3-demethylubiquinone-9 3-methyltransferase (glyoxalase superfamily)
MTNPRITTCLWFEKVAQRVAHAMMEMVKLDIQTLEAAAAAAA